tara:strand:- start:382 stop:567 length:186 start_codon:yes stop_codon:yes gene_type:complete
MNKINEKKTNKIFFSFLKEHKIKKIIDRKNKFLINKMTKKFFEKYVCKKFSNNGNKGILDT